MNRYFLLIACLQLIPQLTPISPITTWFPLTLIFALSAIKEAIDDYKRYVQDKQTNGREYTLIRHGETVLVKSEDIHVGDIVKVNCNEEFPCDIVMLKSSNDMGSCYIQTANIDGETDLKSRCIPKGLQDADLSEFYVKRVRIHCPLPNNHIYSFDATFSIENSGEQSILSLSPEQLLLQGTFLRNTEYVYGAAVYTGNETKLGKNKSKPLTKLTKLDKLIDYGCLLIFSFQMTLVLIFGMTGNILAVRQFINVHRYAAPETELQNWYDYLIIPGRMLLLFSFMIPISLKVTLDIVKFIMSQFIDWDLKMYNRVTDEPAHAANTSLTEELGQIQYIFTDKTGTLTENSMLFKLCSIGSRKFGGNTMKNVSEDTDLVSSTNISKESDDFYQYMMCLAICHSVEYSESDDKYYGSSPDEEALVSSASNLKFQFLRRQGDQITVKVFGHVKEYTLLYSLEFTSARKRMSVVVRDNDTQKVYLYTKGADDIIFGICANSQWLSRTMSYVDEFANSGYRTLCVAYGEISPDTLKEWEVVYHEMSTALADRESKVLSAFEKLEQNLVLLGSTAVEDQLQEKVPETLYTLRKAGLKIWMLTGDKRATAVQIAQSCNLILQDTFETHIHLESTGKSYVELKIMIDQFCEALKNDTPGRSFRPKDFCVIVDGATIRKIFEHSSCLDSFLALSLQARSVICCRVSPHQKALVVELVKNANLTTLAIGDGGNDVAMIQAANIGVGIKGREGRQAALASDYSIGRFNYLARLILIHGRYAYKRTAFVALYCIYKSVFLGLMQAYYQFFCGFTGTSLFSSYALSTYNLFFTALPIMFFCLDKDIKESSVYRFPEVYQENMFGYFFGPSVFFFWLSRAVFQSLIVLTCAVYQYGLDHISANGLSDSNDLVAMLAYSCAVFIQTVTIILAHNTIFWINGVVIAGSIILYFVLTAILALIPVFGIYGLQELLFGDLSFWLISIAITTTAILPLLIAKYFRVNYFPRYFEVIQFFELGQLPTLRSDNIELEASSVDISPAERKPHVRKASVSSNKSNSPLIAD